MINALIDFILSIFQNFVQFVDSLITQLIALIVDIFNHVFTWLQTLLPEEVFDTFDQISTFWVDFQPLVEFMTYFVPVYGILGVILTTYGIVSAIRLTRWLLAAIPRPFTGL